VAYASLIQRDADVPLAVRIGSLALQLNDPSGALPWLQRAAGARGDDIAVLRMLGEAQLRTGAVADARATVSRARALDPVDTGLQTLDRQVRRAEAR
jgi:Flp pilus assembly protein TadD